MPLLDHFHPPLKDLIPWESFYSNWATRIADAICERLPPEFQVEEHTYSERNVTDTIPLIAWSPSAPARTMPVIFPDSVEVRVFSTMAGLTLVGIIELISPSNKGSPEERRAFAAKCASYLYRGVSLILIDIVTDRRANLHNETMRLMEAAPEMDLPAETHLYAVAYRPVLRQERPEIDLWMSTFTVGAALPTLPLRLTGDLFVPVDFEATYQEACRRRRLA